MNKQEVRSRIEEIGIIPAVRVSSAEDALFAAEAVSRGGIPIVEVTLTVPDAHHVISHLVQNAPDVIVGAGGVNDVKTARRCLDAGASFLTSDGIRPRNRRPCGGGECGCDSRNPDSERGTQSVEAATRFRQGCSLRTSGRGELHPGLEGDVSKRPLIAAGE